MFDAHDAEFVDALCRTLVAMYGDRRAGAYSLEDVRKLRNIADKLTAIGPDPKFTFDIRLLHEHQAAKRIACVQLVSSPRIGEQITITDEAGDQIYEVEWVVIRMIRTSSVHCKSNSRATIYVREIDIEAHHKQARR